MSKKKTDPELTANEITDVRDIKNDLLYTKSGNTIGYLRLMPINIDLISDNEKEIMTNNLSAEFSSEKDGFTLLSIPRTVDMEVYLNSLSDAYDQELDNPFRKDILKDMIRQATDIVLNGENFEHQFFVKVWSTYNANVSGTERIVHQRVNDIRNHFEAIQNKTKDMDDREILRLCNLYSNSNTAAMESHDENIRYTPIPRINRKKD